MNLTEYFFDRYDSNKYPYYDRMIKRYDSNKWIKYPCNYIDDEEIISKWKLFTYPSSVQEDEESIFEFLLLSFYLLNEGYEIVEHPNLLFKIDSSSNISDGTFKASTREKYGTKPDGSVAWSSRRMYSDNLTFKKKSYNIPYSNNINDIFKLVSTSNRDFLSMTLDEKLEQIRNVFSYIGQDEKGKYINFDIENTSNGLISKENLIKYQNDIQCFRHGEKNMIEKREQFNDEQKMFLIDFGLAIINVVERFVNNKNNNKQ